QIFHLFRIRPLEVLRVHSPSADEFFGLPTSLDVGRRTLDVERWTLNVSMPNTNVQRPTLNAQRPTGNSSSPDPHAQQEASYSPDWPGHRSGQRQVAAT